MINNEKMLTTRQKQILEYIRTCVHKFGYPPSVREICKEVGLSSTSTVHGYLHRLEDLGYIRRDPAKNRTIELLDEGSWRSKKIVPLPLVGQVRAGAPIFAEECVEDVYPFPADFIGNDDCFMLVVQGDSMKNAWGGDVTLANDADNGQFSITLDNVPQDACMQLARFQPDSWESVNGSVVDPTDVGAIVETCTAASSLIFTAR